MDNVPAARPSRLVLSRASDMAMVEVVGLLASSVRGMAADSHNPSIGGDVCRAMAEV